MNILSQNDQVLRTRGRKDSRRRSLPLASAAFAILFSPLAFAAAHPLRIVVPSTQTTPEQSATTMLAEEAAKLGVPTPTIASGPLTAPPTDTPTVVLANRSAIPALLPPALRQRWQTALAALHPTAHPEAFSIVSLAPDLTVIAGNDARGELFGAGYLLRQIDCSTTCIPAHLSLFSAPDKPIRGHQIGYRNKNNTYDAWTLPQFEQQIRDLAIFGTNALQLIAPVSDDAATSPLYPAPALETVLGISALLQKYGLDCDLYYPELRDYSKPGAVDSELADFEALVRAMPAVDSLHIPGGDPGHTPPELLFPLLARETAILHRYHPGATVWVSAQGFDAARYARFYQLLDAHPAWLTGVFFGPQSRDSFATQRQRIPARYAMQFYPDIAHTMHAQFPVPQWDPIWALTEGREPICPRPDAFATIYRHYQALHSGFFTYSEGVNDDVNKIVFTALGWSPTTPIDTILAEYSRVFLHQHGTDLAYTVRGIKGLEEAWTGPIEANKQIPLNLLLIENNITPAQTAHNGRWESLLYRATYDDYVQRKLARERTAEQAAYTALSQPATSSEDRISAARKALANTTPRLIEQQEHDRLFTLAAALFHDWGLQLSVPLYHAENWERGANLDRVDTPLTDAAWLNHALDEALQQPTEATRQSAIDAIADWQHPVPGALYDDLGDPANEPHLHRGTPWADDPAMYHAAIDGIADRTLAPNPSPANLTAPSAENPWRLSWLDYAETLYETPLELDYTGLDPHRTYRVRITYAGEDYALPLRLTANNTIEIHPARLRHSNPETVEFPVPAAATANGQLQLRWTGPSGSPGSGRGRQVAEVWLIPQ
jgi:hypothetical protein